MSNIIINPGFFVPLQKVPVFKNLPIFSGLSDDDLCIIASIMKGVSSNSGEVVISEGDEGGSLFIIQKGSVEVYKAGGQCIVPDGAKQIWSYKIKCYTPWRKCIKSA
jgi:hypothetical protein